MWCRLALTAGTLESSVGLHEFMAAERDVGMSHDGHVGNKYDTDGHVGSLADTRSHLGSTVNTGVLDGSTIYTDHIEPFPDQAKLKY